VLVPPAHVALTTVVYAQERSKKLMAKDMTAQDVKKVWESLSQPNTPKDGPPPMPPSPIDQSSIGDGESQPSSPGGGSGGDITRLRHDIIEDLGDRQTDRQTDRQRASSSVLSFSFCACRTRRLTGRLIGGCRVHSAIAGGSGESLEGPGGENG
jgi:hypothetical protein